MAGNTANLAGAAADLKLQVNTQNPAAATSASTFTIAGGADLELFASAQFSGTVAGLAPGNFLDLADIGFVPANTPGYTPNGGSGGTLNVTDGIHTANIALLGSYTASAFAASSDGHGGTLITDLPPLQNAALSQPHA